MTHEIDCVAILFFTKKSLYFPVTNWHVMAKAHFRYSIRFEISEKRIMRCAFLRGVRVAPKFSTRHTEKLCTRDFNFFSP